MSAPTSETIEGSEPAARPTRLRRGELSRERVLAAALSLVEREGPSALSMRRVAAEIGTAPMSLYRHVRDKADLLDGVIALALGDLSTSPPEGATWADRVHAWMLELRAGFRARPAIVGMIRTDHMLLPAVLAPVEVLLGELHAAGFERETAAKAAWELMWFTLSFVHSEQLAGTQPALAAFARAAEYGDELPRIAEALPSLTRLGGDDIFRASARHLVDGLRAQHEAGRA